MSNYFTRRLSTQKNHTYSPRPETMVLLLALLSAAAFLSYTSSTIFTLISPNVHAAIASPCNRVVTGDQPGLNRTTYAMAADGITGTGFQSSYNNWQYVQIDFSCVGDLSGVRRHMTRNGTTSGRRIFQGEGIAFSLDGVNWINVGRSDTTGWESYVGYAATAWHSVPYGWSQWLRLRTPVKARFLRFRWDGDSDTLNEIEPLFTEPPPVVSESQPAVRQGGRAVAIAVNPNDGNQILVASETGGLFRSTNRGLNWTHISTLPNHRIWDVEFSPNTPNLVIAAVASNFKIPNDGGIWRSTDGGLNWTRPIGAVPLPGPRCTERSFAYDVTFEPSSSRVFVGTDCGLATSFDNGASWSHRALDLTARPNSSLTQNAVFSVLATTDYLLMAAADGLWRSGTSGFTRARITNGPARGQGNINHAFAVSPLNPFHVFHAGGVQQLFLSTDAGVNWAQVPAPSNFNRGVFVRVTRARSRNPNEIDVYFGDGVSLQRQTFTQSQGRLAGSGTWTQVFVDHGDPADIGFDSAGVAVLVATDGGVHTTGDGGATWRMAGGGRSGFNALQINEVMGQAIGGAQPHQDLYYATQDNNIVASADGGATWPFQTDAEGFNIRVTPGSAVNEFNTQVTGVRCFPCRNFRAGAHLTNVNDHFPIPPDGDSRNGDVDGTPFPISQGTYLQNTMNNDAMAPVNNFLLTPNNGGMWRAAFTITQGLSGPPVIVGPAANPTVYQAVIRPGSRIGLVRATNFLSGAGTVSNADVHGFGSIGVFLGMWQDNRIFAANPVNPLQLIYADVETNEMKFSVDGGQNWFVDRALTDLVTGNGTFAFSREEHGPIGERTHVRTISFDPINPCLVLVGTDQNGVIRSGDGGNTWSKLNGSESLNWPTSFYFPPTGPVVASTYGRGLWQVLDRTAQASCQPPRPPHMLQSSGRIIDVSTGESAFIRAFGDPQLCANCSYIIVRNGVITDLEMKANKLTAVMVSGGSVHQLDSSKREIPLSVPNLYARERSNFDQFPKVSSLLTARGTMIRGIVVEGDVLKYIIVSETELPFDPPRIPYVRLTSTNMAGGVVRIEPGGEVNVHGEGFSSLDGSQGKVRIFLGDELMSEGVVIDSEGHFRTKFVVQRMPGDYEVIVEQREGLRLTREKARLKIIIGERER